LDGYAAYIILRCYFKKENINVEYCTHGNIDDRVEKFMGTVNYKIDYMFITDISIKDEELAKKLEICNLLFKDIKLKMLDHHEDGLGFNKYSFADVEIERDGRLICGSSLFYQYLISELNFPRLGTLETWLDIVNDYDTWMWEEKNNKLAKNWNELFYLYERNKFVENTVEKINNQNIKFNKIDKILLDTEHEKQDMYIKTKVKTALMKTIQGFNCVVVFAEQYVNELSSALYEKFPNSDIQIVITGKSISYRARNQKPEIDLNAFASAYGGGGHKYAAGSTITNETKNEYLKLLFNL
jgi:oligoribonuclease NrnB/cAMP/cGMP phosphodiesterase (DHH superfamily)